MTSLRDGTSSGEPAAAQVPATHRSWRPAAVAVVAFGGLTLAVAGRGQIGLDRLIERRVGRSERPRLLELLIETAPSAALAMSCTAAVAAWCARDRVTSLFCLLTPPLAAGLASWVLKPAIARPWPGGLEFAFPSGHATLVTAVSVVCAVVARDPVQAVGTRRAAAVLLWPAVLLTLAVFLALVVLRHHFVTDVLGGALAAIAIVLLAARSLEQAQGPV